MSNYSVVQHALQKYNNIIKKIIKLAITHPSIFFIYQIILFTVKSKVVFKVTTVQKYTLCKKIWQAL